MQQKHWLATVGLASLLGLTPGQPADAGERLPSELATLLANAQASSPMVQAEQAGEDVARSMGETAVWWPHPSLEFVSGSMWYEGELMRMGNQASLMVDLPRGQELTARREASQAELAVAQWGVERARRDLEREVRLMWLDIRTHEGMVHRLEQHIELYRRLDDTLRSAISTGDMPTRDLGMLGVQRYQLEIQCQGIRTREEGMRRRLNLLLQREVDAPLPTPEPLGYLIGTLDQALLEAGVGQDLEAAQALARAEVAEAGARVALAMARPMWSASLMVGSLFPEGLPVISGETMLMAGLGVEWPTSRQLAAREAAASQAMARMQTLESSARSQEVALQMWNLLEDLAVAQATQDTLTRQLLPRAQASAELARSALATGGSLSDVLEAQRMNIMLQMQLEEARRLALASVIGLEILAGHPLGLTEVAP